MEIISEKSIILVTAALNWDNLINVAMSINKYKDIFKGNKLIWLVCHDKYNGHGDKYEVIRYCNACNISIVCYDSGLPNQANYGGDIYNKPLQDLSNRLSLDPINTWIYILDDDNLVHPNLFRTFEVAIKNTPNCRMIWMNYMIESGVIPDVRSDNAMTVNRNNTMYNNFPDPSCIFIRLDKLQEVGWYDSGFDYDLKFGKKAIENHLDEISFPDTHMLYYKHLVSAFHNGQQGLHNIDKDLNKIKDGILNDITLRTQSWDDNPNVYPIPTELASVFIEMLKNYYKNIGFNF